MKISISVRFGAFWCFLVSSGACQFEDGDLKAEIRTTDS
jgi:hypothetical protein